MNLYKSTRTSEIDMDEDRKDYISSKGGCTCSSC